MTIAAHRFYAARETDFECFRQVAFTSLAGSLSTASGF